MKIKGPMIQKEIERSRRAKEAHRKRRSEGKNTQEREEESKERANGLHNELSD